MILEEDAYFKHKEIKYKMSLEHIVVQYSQKVIKNNKRLGVYQKNRGANQKNS